MSDQRRERQLLKDAEEMAPPPPPRLPPHLQQIVDMPADARQCVFFVDLLREAVIPSMINQLGLIGGIRFVPAFMQLLKGLESFRAQLLMREGSPIAIAQPDDAPQPPAT